MSLKGYSGVSLIHVLGLRTTNLRSFCILRNDRTITIRYSKWIQV